MTLHPLNVPDATDGSDSVISQEIREIVALFDDGGALDGLVFPEVDHAAFHALISDVNGCGAGVIEAGKLLAEARAALATAESMIARRAQLALAYARVYAADNPALMETFQALTLSRRLARQSKPRRRRKRAAMPKSAASGKSTAELPLVAVG